MNLVLTVKSEFILTGVAVASPESGHKIRPIRWMSSCCSVDGTMIIQY